MNERLLDLYEQCDRYDDIVGAFKDFIKETDLDLNNDQYNRLSLAFYNIYQLNLTNVRILNNLEKKELMKDSSPNLSYIQEYKNKLEAEFIEVLFKFKNTISQLLQRTQDTNRKICYINNMARYSQKIFNYAKGELKAKAYQDTIELYTLATQESNSLSPLNPISLSIVQNFSDFYFENGEKNKAISMIKEALDIADKENKIEYKETDIKDSESIIKLLEENLEMFLGDL